MSEQSQNTTNNKRLAKNTISMYIRMLFLMFISFYTSRVVLQALGTTDFGIYNIVGGIVVLFTFVNGAMTTGTQRHLSFELGKTDGNVNRIFSACLLIHICLALLIVILAETIGLWFLNSKMNFPPDRMDAVNWVYQLSILACVINVIRIPYGALIMAYERMTFYAYIGIVEGLLKLGIVYLLAIGGFDKLIFYAALSAIVLFSVTIIYYIFCKTKFSEINTYIVKDSSLYKYLLSFSGWTIFGSIANIARNQGIGIIINIFYGVTLNAAIGIANQVNAGISQFVTGFQAAFNPQLTKVEAQNDREYQSSLINKTVKFSYFIILFFAVPILYNLDYILTFWLGKYPEYSKEICFWIVVATLVDSISGPLWVTIFAYGKIHTYQVVISALLLLNLPLTYLCGYMGWQPQWSFAFLALLNGLAIVVRILFMRHQIHFSISRFFQKTIIPILIVTASVYPAIYILNFTSSSRVNFFIFLYQSIILFVYLSIMIYLFGLNPGERKLLFTIINRVKKS